MQIARWEQIQKNLYALHFLDYTSEYFPQFEAEYKRFWDSQNEAELIFDTTTMRTFDATCVIKQIALNIEMQPVHKSKLKKFTIVVNQPWVHRFISMVFAASPPVCEYNIETI